MIEIFGAILFIIGVFVFVLSFFYLAEKDSIIGFILIIITGIGIMISSGMLVTKASEKVKEYSVIYLETYTSDHGNLYEFIIEDKDGTCARVITTEDEKKLYYRDNKFFISDNELSELKGE